MIHKKITEYVEPDNICWPILIEKNLISSSCRSDSLVEYSPRAIRKRL